MNDRVRPTQRALTDLGLIFPPLETVLSSLESPIIRKAQQVPAEVASGGAERIVSLSDRVWFKAKVSSFRGAVGAVETPETYSQQVPQHGWWLVACGSRQDDSVEHDFYAALTAECRRRGSGSGGVDSSHLEPQAVDFRRWIAENATVAVLEMKALVLDAIRRSASDGQLWTCSFAGHAVGALVRSVDGESYLAITTEGYYDPNVVAILLSAVPGVDPDDWQAEPGDVLGIEPAEGQIIFSTMIRPEILASLIG